MQVVSGGFSCFWHMRGTDRAVNRNQSNTGLRFGTITLCSKWDRVALFQKQFAIITGPSAPCGDVG